METSSNSINYIVNDSGDLDVNYYINKAHNLRSQAIRDGLVKIGSGIKSTLASLMSGLRQPEAA